MMPGAGSVVHAAEASGRMARVGARFFSWGNKLKNESSLRSVKI